MKTQVACVVALLAAGTLSAQTAALAPMARQGDRPLPLGVAKLRTEVRIPGSAGETIATMTFADPAGRAMESKSRQAEDADRPVRAAVEFPGPPPGPPRAEATGQGARLANKVLSAEWKVEGKRCGWPSSSIASAVRSSPAAGKNCSRSPRLLDVEVLRLRPGGAAEGGPTAARAQGGARGRADRRLGGCRRARTCHLGCSGPVARRAARRQPLPPPGAGAPRAGADAHHHPGYLVRRQGRRGNRGRRSDRQSRGRRPDLWAWNCPWPARRSAASGSAGRCLAASAGTPAIPAS